jgi:hypothetical protein
VKNDVINNIKSLYMTNLLDDDDVSAITKRVHSVYHLSRLQVDDRDKFIDQALSKEKNISVRLSLYFGAIKSGSLEKEEKLYQLLKSNPEYSDANRGYHLAYYSDMIMENKLPFKDNPSLVWNGTLNAFLRHFGSLDDGHYFLWRIDLLTMRLLMEVRNSTQPVDSDIIDKIEKHICDRNNLLNYPEFQNKVKIEFEKMVSTWRNLSNIIY